MIREAVERCGDVRFDRAHFKEYGDSAIVFDTVYHVTRPEYDRAMDIQLAINLEILHRFEDGGIEFAYPTRVIYTRDAEVANAP